MAASVVAILDSASQSGQRMEQVLIKLDFYDENVSYLSRGMHGAGIIYYQCICVVYESLHIYYYAV